MPDLARVNAQSQLLLAECFELRSAAILSQLLAGSEASIDVYPYKD
jgi:hypothetical protein